MPRHLPKHVPKFGIDQPQNWLFPQELESGSRIAFTWV